VEIINKNIRVRKIDEFRGQIFCHVERSKGRKEGTKKGRKEKR
jgi:hypothetical protein